MKSKTIGILLLLTAFFIGSFNVIYRTSFTIQDYNPTTYMIVVLLMLFVMLAFGIKEDISMTNRTRDFAIGLVAVFAYFLIVSYLRLLMSFVFYVYRVDALLLPLLLLGIIIAIFGVEGARKLKKQLVYSVFASPAVLLPLIEMNSRFVDSVANLTYWIMKLVGEPVSKAGLTILAPSSYSISIASTCADLGAFIALAMFLIPIAYFYEGPKTRKLYWLVSGIALFFVLNIIRVFSIASIWVYYGINSAVATFHLFVGQILFYIAIIVMLLIAGKFGLSIWNIREHKKEPHIHRDGGAAKVHISKNAAIALGIGIIGFLITVPYQSSIYMPLLSINTTQQGNMLSLYKSIIAPLETAHMNISVLESNNYSAIIALSNQTFNRTKPIYIIAKREGRAIQYGMLANYTSVENSYSVVLNDGITLNSAFINSSGVTFYINYFLLPYKQLNGNWSVIGYETFYKLNESTENIAAGCIPSTGIINRIESEAYNFMNGRFSGPQKMMCLSISAAENN
ncbi:MAG: exosortase/archaeosortase family protein [Candidatus Micrarchaeia archaeon]